VATQTPITILYVDDEEANRRSFSWIFRNEGFRVREAATGSEALRLAAEKPDLVVLDVNLPDMNGFEVCRRIKSHPATTSIPVLHISAMFVRSQDKMHGLEAGADGYLVKPVEPQEMLAQVKALLRVRKAEEAARTAARQWRATFDALSDAVCLLDQKGIVVRCNRAMAGLLRRPFPEIIGRPYRQLTKAAFSSEEAACLASAQPVSSREMTELALSGRWFRLRVDPVRDDQGVAIGSVHRLADITERKRIEEQLRQTQKLEAIGQLAAGVAHDFNNLLTAITGNVSLLLAQTPKEEPAFEPLTTIDKAAWRAAELVRQLLSFSRQGKLQLKALNLNQSVAEAVRFLRRTIDPRITVEAAGATELWPVRADPGQVNRLIMNLCLNARDAMPQGGSLVLETANVTLLEEDASRHAEALPGEFVRLRVRDTGCGIPPAVQRHIFEPFFTTKEPGKGTGLGLATVFGIVKQHCGWIECASVIDRGTTFDVYLPRCLKAQATSLPTSGPTPGRGQETILLVDDEPMLRSLGKNILEQYGYRVLLAEDGAEAVDIYQREGQQIDLIILDLTMPRMSGPDALRKLRQINPAVRSLFASGYFAGPEAPCAEEEIAGFIHKPYRPHDLANLVRMTLDRNEATEPGQSA
jgi:PAS domain S-box-containing protein